MSTLLHAIRQLGEWAVRPFDYLSPTLGLVAIAIVTAVIMVLVVGKVTPQAKIKRARNKMASAIYEIRLFLDSPRRVFAAQGRLLWSGLVYTWLLMPAFLVLTAPLGLLFLHLESRHGLAPLTPGGQTVVTVELESGTDGYSLEPGDLPEGLRVTAPALVDEDKGLVYLRVEADEGVHQLPLSVAGAVTQKQIEAGAVAAVSPTRSRGLSLLWTIGNEKPLSSDVPVDSISVDYPVSEREWFGLAMPWWLFWLLTATIGALIVKRPLRVEL